MNVLLSASYNYYNAGEAKIRTVNHEKCGTRNVLFTHELEFHNNVENSINRSQSFVRYIHLKDKEKKQLLKI